MYKGRWKDDSCQVMSKALIAFGQVKVRFVTKVFKIK